MRRMVSLISLLVLLLSAFVAVPPAPVQAAPGGTGATEYWLAFPGNLAEEGALNADLYILADAPASFTVTIPGTGFVAAGTAAPGSPATVFLPEVNAIQSSEVVEGKGIHVTSDKPVNVVFRSPEPVGAASDDAYLGLPVESLGKNFVVMAFRDDLSDYGYSSGPSQMTLVATQDGTTVQVTPSCTSVGGHPAGSVISLTLNEGQSYQYRCLGGGDVTGSRVEATAPVAVFGGSRCAFIPPGVWACDYLVEQILPLEMWGTEYMAAPVAYGTDTLVRMLASENGTTVQIDNGSAPTIVTLAAGQPVDLYTQAALHITSDKPILVAEFGVGATYGGLAARDPFFMQVIPASLGVSGHRFIAPAGYSSHTATMVAPAGATVLLDGAPVTGWLPMPGGTHVYASRALSAGEHTISADQPVAAYSYGFRTDASYGYPTGVAKPESCAEEPALTWKAPLSSGTPVDLSAAGTLPIRFSYGSCDGFLRDESVYIQVVDPSQPDYPVTAYVYGYDIAIDEGSQEYQQDFQPAFYGVAPGADLDVQVFIGDQLVGTAQVHVTP